ncbi:MAG: class D beta-lactamase [Massilia sp.]
MNYRKLVISAAVSICALSSARATELCTAIADASTGKVLMQRGDCSRRVTPASTFKIAISLMGYDAGFLKDEHTPRLPFRDGYVDWRDNWKEATDPSKWMRDSVVWYSQQVTRSLGQERFAAYAKKFGFGNADVSGDAEHEGLTMSWIGSSLQISPLEQLTFLGKLVNRQLGASQHAYDMTTALTRNAPLPGGWNVNGKIGASSGYGWYVGWTSHGSRALVFAHLIQKDASQPQEVPVGVLAREGFVTAFPALVGPLGL